MGRKCALAVAVLGVQAVAGGTAQAAGEIGDVVDVLTAAYGQPPALEKRQLFPEETVFADEVVETVPEGGLTVQFHDGSALTLGGDSRVVLDQFVYDPGQGSDAIELGTGVFRFISGELGHGQGFQVKTPTASIGVRGTDFVIVVDADGTTTVGTVSGLVNAAQRAGSRAINLLPGSYAVIRPDRDDMEVGIAPVPVDDAFALALWFGGDIYVALSGLQPAAGTPAPVFGAPVEQDDEPSDPVGGPAAAAPAAPAAPAAAPPPDNDPPADDPPDDGDDDHDHGHGHGHHDDDRDDDHDDRDHGHGGHRGDHDRDEDDDRDDDDDRDHHGHRGGHDRDD